MNCDTLPLLFKELIGYEPSKLNPIPDMLLIMHLFGGKDDHTVPYSMGSVHFLKWTIEKEVG